ncbi:MAG TPA: zf-HC2 domain-containing protein [Terriglobia bacterium]|nr:zf-HC2 domain-containing protein [Terriglobia bacterium]
MGCPDRKARLMDWVLDELAPAEARELEQHVEHCADCSRSVDRLRAIRGALAKNLVDVDMPAHLVFVPEERRSVFAGFLRSLGRTAALAAAAAVVFVGIWVAGASRWNGRLVATGSPGSRGPAALSRDEVKALAAQEVERQMALERQDREAASEKLATSLRDEQARNLDLMSRQVSYVQSVQNTVWKETQQQGAVVELIARNTLGPTAAAPGSH